MIHHGDAITVLRERFGGESVQCCVTSPPYWGLRDYGVAGQLGLEATPDLYVAAMVAVFREVRRVLKIDGTLWLNLGDSYAGSWGNYHPNSPSGKHGQRLKETTRWNRPAYQSQEFLPPTAKINGLKPKDLVGIPWRVAFALQADGWYLRSDIIWAKPNPMPESVTDRPTKAHEYLFLLAKSEKYYYDNEAIKVDGVMASIPKMNGRPAFNDVVPEQRGFDRKSTDEQRGHGRRHAGFNDRWDSMTKDEQCRLRVNKRTVWEIATTPYAEAHFATFPAKLVEPCILAGCPSGGLVLDPFAGSGTTLMVAQQLGRHGVGIELNTDYIALADTRAAQAGLPL